VCALAIASAPTPPSWAFHYNRGYFFSAASFFINKKAASLEAAF
jgi:hypothetical protein